MRYLVLGRRPEPIPSYTGLVEPPETGKVGIACSGGGIRSAAFNLGALQALQGEKVLERSRYLSSVSGGSYIAAAFCMVRKTWAGEERPPKGSPGWDDSDPSVLDERRPPFFPGSPEEEYLRNRSSYLAPGLFGKIQLGYRVLLGLAFNLGFIGLTLAAVAVPLAALYGWLYPSLDKSLSQCSEHCNFSAWPPPEGLWIPILGLAGFALVVGVGSMVAFRWAPWLRDFTATWSLRLLLLAVVAAALLIGIPVLLAALRRLSEPAVSPGPIAKAAATEPGKPAVLIGAGSVATVGAGVFLQLRADWLEVRKFAKEAVGVAKWYTGLGQRLRRVLAYLIATIAGPALALALMLLVMSAILNIQQPYVRWIWFGGFAAAFAIVYVFADLTTWSLHPFYRRRLASAFALKRVERDPSQTPPIADQEAGVALERDYDKLVSLSKTAIERDEEGRCQWPTLLVCAAANVSDNAATPPGRAVTSFTFSATAMGGPLVGAVKTAELEDRCDHHRLSYFTLPAAVAMSGAALSPSMGKMTRRPLRMLMGFANIRLGVWVPNPRRLEKFAKGGFYPRPRPSYLLRELLGINPINAPFLYVTDGGHYENLGMMELLRRGCTEIYCFDASNDHFDALGDLVSLARSELEVEIEIDLSPLKPNKVGLSMQDCVCGTIAYPGEGVPPGRLYYSRPVITRDGSADVTAYHAQDPRFPRDPTGDQLYTDQRFEAYRALGLRAGRSALAKRRQCGPSSSDSSHEPTS